MFGNKEYITEDQLSEALAPLLKRLDELEKSVKELKKQTATIKADNKSLNDKLSALERQLRASTTDNGNDDELKHINPIPNGGGARRTERARGGAVGPAIFYLPSPTLSGTFQTVSSEEEIGKSIYLLHTEDSIHGTFSLLQSPDAMATAMISVSQFLKPVCRITGDTHHVPDRMETIEEGEAQMKDGVWTMTKKAVVEFISK